MRASWCTCRHRRRHSFRRNCRRLAVAADVRLDTLCFCLDRRARVRKARERRLDDAAASGTLGVAEREALYLGVKG